MRALVTLILALIVATCQAGTKSSEIVTCRSTTSRRGQRLQLKGITYIHFSVEEIYTIDGASVGVPTVDDFVDFVLDKCEKNGGSSASVALKESWKLFVDGFSLLADMTWDETEKFDTVMQTYYRRDVILNDFEKYFIDTFKSCLAPEEQETADIAKNIPSALLRKLCDNEGKGITEFIAAFSAEWVAARESDIEYCVKQSLGISRDGIDWKGPLRRLQRPLVIDAEDCTDFRQLRYCIFNALSNHEDWTPAYSLDSLFGTVQNEVSCPPASY